jgi:hypothetical protein
VQDQVVVDDEADQQRVHGQLPVGLDLHLHTTREISLGKERNDRRGKKNAVKGQEKQRSPERGGGCSMLASSSSSSTWSRRRPARQS